MSSVADREIWWTNASLWESKIYLPRQRNAWQHPVPIDMNTLCKRSPKPGPVPVAHLPGLHASRSISRQQLVRSGPDQGQRQAYRSNFRRDCLRTKLAWPEFNYTTAPGLLILSVTAKIAPAPS